MKVRRLIEWAQVSRLIQHDNHHQRCDGDCTQHPSDNALGYAWTRCGDSGSADVRRRHSIEEYTRVMTHTVVRVGPSWQTTGWLIGDDDSVGDRQMSVVMIVLQ